VNAAKKTSYGTKNAEAEKCAETCRDQPASFPGMVRMKSKGHSKLILLFNADFGFLLLLRLQSKKESKRLLAP
jgi:hypothetical protein